MGDNLGLTAMCILPFITLGLVTLVIVIFVFCLLVINVYLCPKNNQPVTVQNFSENDDCESAEKNKTE